MGLGAAIAFILSLIVGRIARMIQNGLAERETWRPRPEAEARLLAERDRLRVENAMLTNRLVVSDHALKEKLRAMQAEKAKLETRLAEIEARLRA